jgi:hypothetical protein
VPEALKKAWKGFVSQAHALGAVYYAWALLSTLVPAAYSVYKQLSTPAITGESEWFFWLFIGGIALVLLVAPILGAAIIRSATKGQDKLIANPTLEISKRDVVYKVTPTSVSKQQTLLLKALDTTTSFRLHVAVTGIGKTVIALTCPGVTLLGPLQRGSGDSYEIQFANPLERGQVMTISFDIRVDDPSRTMRCFLADRFHNAAGYGSFSAKYVFEPRPSGITKERQNVQGETVESSNQLHTRTTATGCEYAFSVNKVDAECIYSVSWVW